MKNNNIFVIISILVVGILGYYLITVPFTNKKDDWQYSPGSSISDMISNAGGALSKSQMTAGAPMTDSLGFAVGGAKDINNFRENIENDYFPLFTDITYEGLFYDYYFETGEQECNNLFCPTYNYAISNDPFSQKEDYYLSVGLNSNLNDFQRKKLNLVIVLDISGGMGSPFNRYYYDNPEDSNPEDQKTKMEIANEAVVSLLDHLNDEDRFGLVLFESSAHVAKPVSLVGETDMHAIKDHILEVTDKGGTHMSSGYEKGTELLEKYSNTDPEEYETRIIFLTDAQPNIGELDEDGLLGMTKENAENNIFTTFIGIGVDFNTELIEHITKIKGSNYYSVHNAKEFKQRMDDDFEFMVTPLVFDLVLELDAEGFEILKVYGSPEADEATGKIMTVNTLFPSKKENTEVKGGIILIKLRKISDSVMTLKVSYEDRLGNEYSDEKNVEIKDKEPDYYDHAGIRKAVLLSRYADLVKNWIIDERKYENEPVFPLVNYEKGIICPPENIFSKWERNSVSLTVSNYYEELFNDFSSYFKGEMNDINDNNLQQELDILEKLSK